MPQQFYPGEMYIVGVPDFSLTTPLNFAFAAHYLVIALVVRTKGDFVEVCFLPNDSPCIIPDVWAPLARREFGYNTAILNRNFLNDLIQAGEICSTFTEHAAAGLGIQLPRLTVKTGLLKITNMKIYCACRNGLFTIVHNHTLFNPKTNKREVDIGGVRKDIARCKHGMLKRHNNEMHAYVKDIGIASNNPSFYKKLPLTESDKIELMQRHLSNM